MNALLMLVDFSRLHLKKVAIHRIYRWKKEHGETPPHPELADSLIVPDVEYCDLFESKIRRTIDTKRAQRIRPDAKLVSEGNMTPARIRAMLQSDASLLEESQALARDISSLQGHRGTYDYLLVITRGKCGPDVVLVVFMVPIQKGMGITLDHEHHTPTIQLVKEMMMEERGKLVRAAAFSMVGDELDGIIEDTSRGDRMAAEYIARDFLGCRAVENAAKLTSDWRKAAISFVNQQIANDEDREQIGQAIAATLKRQDGVIDVDEFKRTYVPANYRAAYDEVMRTAALSEKRIELDLSMVPKKRVTHRQYKLEHGLEISGTPEAFKKHVQTEVTSNGTVITIRANITEIL